MPLEGQSNNYSPAAPLDQQIAPKPEGATKGEGTK